MPPLPRTEDRVVTLPLSASRWAYIRSPFPMTEEEWSQMESLLKTMKPGLVIKTEDSTLAR
ncbi:hypothetical protein CMI37_28825 [Candidatus Pacearchaeota archaeon]|nr:hypothetical protein [Candidatus Pacearchaeota archaeon]